LKANYFVLLIKEADMQTNERETCRYGSHTSLL